MLRHTAHTPLSLMLVDASREGLAQLRQLLSAQPDLRVVASATSADQALDAALQTMPDVLLIDISELGMAGVAAVQSIVAELAHVQTLMIVPRGSLDTDFLRQAMLAGAREFLVKPFTADDLLNSLRKFHPQRSNGEGPPQTGSLTAALDAVTPPSTSLTRALPAQGALYTLFSANGGIGRSTLAVNLAIALRALTKSRVALVDCSLRFGDIGALLNIRDGHTIVDLAASQSGIDSELLSRVLVTHDSGVKVLLAPNAPEFADLVTPAAMGDILTHLRREFDHVVVDTYTYLDETILTIFEHSSQLLFMTTSEIPALKNARQFLHLCELLNYPPDKVRLILSQHNPKGRLSVAEIEAGLKHSIYAVLEKDDQTTTQSVQMGQPFVSSQKSAPLSLSVYRLAAQLTMPEGSVLPEPKRSRLARFRK